MATEADKLRWKASKVFAPNFPRQSSDQYTIQDTRYDRAEFATALGAASDYGNPGYYSVYSFPRGHSQDGNIPEVDCLFIDLDVPGDDYQPNENKPDYDVSFAAWKRSMSDLLARSRMIAQAMLGKGYARHYRAVLSGHKGLHLYLDFPAIAPENGEFGQFKAGLAEYGDTVMETLDALAGGVNIDPWVDVDASDLGRLARHPNTRHHGAKYDDVDRWAVPVTIEELADLYVEDYLDLTTGPRWPDEVRRQPSEGIGNKVVQAIRTAASSDYSSESGSSWDPQAVANYDEQANEDIELADVLMLTSNKPCIKAFRERTDAYNYGDASRAMELSVMGRLIDMNVPRDVIHEFFEPIPGYSESVTDDILNDLIGRGYAEFNCETICDRAPQFCLGDACGVYRNADDLQK